MSKAELIEEVRKLDPRDRRDLVRLVFEIEDDARTLADCDRLAAERFAILDAMETEDAQAKPR